MATKRNLQKEFQRIGEAVRLVKIGLRAPVVAEMTGLTEWYVRKLVIDITGAGPARGQIPNSDAWFMRGRHMMHSVLFLAAYAPIKRAAGVSGAMSEVFVRAMARYRIWVEKAGLPEVLTPDRAWWLLKMLGSRQLKVHRCERCKGFFLTTARDRRFPNHGALCWAKMELSGERHLLES